MNYPDVVIRVGFILLKFMIVSILTILLFDTKVFSILLKIFVILSALALVHCIEKDYFIKGK